MTPSGYEKGECNKILKRTREYKTHNAMWVNVSKRWPVMRRACKVDYKAKRSQEIGNVSENDKHAPKIKRNRDQNQV